MIPRLGLLVVTGALIACGNHSPFFECAGDAVCTHVDPQPPPVVVDPTLPDASETSYDASENNGPDASAPDIAVPSISDDQLAAMCPPGGNSLFVYGDPGGQVELPPTLFDAHSGTWLAEPAGSSYIDIQLQLTDTSLGDGWDISFATQEMRVPLAVQRFDHVRMIPGDNLHAGMYVAGGWQACGAIHGWFEIKELVREPNPQAPESPSLRALTATFEQQCDDEPRVLRGCVHYEMGN